jgi:hypothetical protein
MAAPLRMMPAHRVKLMSEGNTNEEFRDDATKTMASHQVHKGHDGGTPRLAVLPEGCASSVQDEPIGGDSQIAANYRINGQDANWPHRGDACATYGGRI